MVRLTVNLAAVLAPKRLEALVDADLVEAQAANTARLDFRFRRTSYTPLLIGLL